MIQSIMSALILLLSVCSISHAKTLTVGTGQTYTTINSAIAAMANGDIVIIKDGTYSESIPVPKNGTSGAYSIIKAENDGRVIITQPFSLTHASSYISFEGLKFSGNFGKSVVGNHIKILRCAFNGGPSTGNAVNFGIGTNDYNDTQYILVEDSWFYGPGGRYKIMVYNSDKVVLRRVVVRNDAGWTSGTGDPEAGIVVYQSSNVSLQNAIVIDSNLSTYDDNNVGAFYLTGHSGNRSSSNAEYLGCMAINNKGWGWSIDTDDGAVGLTMRDIVVYGQETGGIAQSNTSVAINLQRAAIGGTGYGIGNWGSKTNSLSDFVFLNLTGTPSTGSNTRSNYSTFTTVNTAKTDGLTYLTRIETGSVLNAANRGPSIIKQTGTNGTHWGAPGYNTVTSSSLWPWPNELRIKSDMASVSTRGFATGTSKDGSAQTLTKYIWEYLGILIPTEIYSTTPKIINISITQ